MSSSTILAQHHPGVGLWPSLAPLWRAAIFLLLACATTAVPAPASVSAPSQVGRYTRAHLWESEIKAFEEADRRAAVAEGGVLFVGSSSIRLWETLAADFPSVKVVNRGFGGSHLEDSTHYADRIVIPYRPRLIVLYAGDNDIESGKSPSRVLADFKEFVRVVRRRLPRTRIAFISIKPSPARWHLADQVRRANELIRAYAERTRGLVFIDVFTPMLGSDGKPRPELFVEDGLHLSTEGYRLWRRVISPHVGEEAQS